MKKVFNIGLLLCLALPLAAQEKSHKTLSTPRYTLYLQEAGRIPAQSNLAQEKMRALVADMLDDTHEELARILQIEPKEKVILRFLSEEEFRKQTGAPSWTNAMFFRGEVILPLPTSAELDLEDIKDALRHEYAHALLAEASAYRIPAWLDEGIAQILEGEQNPVLAPSLREMTKANRQLSLDSLQYGFTNLEDEIVPAAYAQSFFATKSLVNKHGFKKIARFLQGLKNGETEELAFNFAFAHSRRDFENQMQRELQRWQESSKREI